LILCAGTANAGIKIVDDFGRTVELEHPAEKIIALYGSFNEIIYAMGQGNRLIARTAADNYPSQILKLPSIGTHMRPNVELITSFKPDLILQMAGRPKALTVLDPLEKFGIPCAVFKVSSFADLFSVIKRLGVLTGSDSGASDLIENMKGRLSAVHSKVESGSQPTVFFEIRYPNLLGAGNASIVNDIINKSGGINCIKANKKISRIGEEELMKLNPDVYIYQKGRMNPSPVSPAKRKLFSMLGAVKNNRIYEVDESVFSRPGPRNVDAVEILSAILSSKDN
jgi:iron complex transport system substrate-binding protein